MTPFKKMTHLELVRGLDDFGPILSIAPTMQKIVHEGKTYWRMQGVRRILDDGTECASYLWDGYGKALRARLARERAEKGESE